jgi:acetyltransferase-like isoleucine patch superfamily enzyme
MGSFLIKWLSFREVFRSRWNTMLYRRIYPNAQELRVLGRIMVSPLQNLVLGNKITINDGVYINARDKVYIGDNTHISSFTIINTGKLNVEGSESRAHITAEVHIGKDVWIASGVIINPGVTIGDGVTVGSGAVVTKDLPPYTLCVGIPAMPIKDMQK